MSLSENMRPAITWGPWGDRKVRVGIVCHCGEVFPISALEAAREHVAGHEGEPEPS